MDVAHSLQDRHLSARTGIRLEYFTIAWNCLEALVGIVSGFVAGSVALIGFGLDSCIEVTSGAALLWRLKHDRDEARRERSERVSLRVVGMCFLALAAYVTFESIETLVMRQAPERSVPGIVLAVASLIVMPLLSSRKRRVAAQISSAAMVADAMQTQLCAYLSAVLLGGLLMNALFGAWWADPLAALVMVPMITREGIEAVRGRACCNSCR